MNRKKFWVSQKNVWGIILLISSVLSAFLSIMQYFLMETSNRSFSLSFFSKLAITTVLFGFIYFSAVNVITVLNKRFPWKTKFKLRLVLEVLMVLFVNTFFYLLISLVTKSFEHRIPFDARAPRFALWMPLIFVTIIAFIVFELQLILEEKKNLELQKELLEKENLMAQYKALKNQVNPHFLFNSLNVLSSLIYKDVKKSDLFIKEFSRVFRYILELNAEPVVKVKKELEVLNSYIFLQQIRYPDNLSINIQFNEAILNKYLPPLALQMLVENSIKHNKISKEFPLNIEVSSNDKNIIVSNNYQPREEEVVSTRVGIKNLKEKYKLISNDEPEFRVENSKFIASIPIIESSYD